MKNLNLKNLRNLARNSLYLLKVLPSYVSLAYQTKWPSLLASLMYLLSQDNVLKKPEPEIEAEFINKHEDDSIMREEGKTIYQMHKELKMPFHFLPSCSNFEVNLGAYDWLLALFGHSIRTPGTIKIRNWRTGSVNKYIFHMFRKLRHHRESGDVKTYWKVAWCLMNSHAYQVCAYNYVRNNWHTGKASPSGLGLSRVAKELADVKLLCATRATEIKFKRVYIPKSSDPLDERKRPLGVPSPAWRVYLHMYNNLLVWARTGQEGSQHAYFPQRGVITAWRDVLSKLSAPNIMEFDLKGFFDAVNLEKLYVTMHRTMKICPKSEAAFVRKLNRSIPIISTRGVLPEPDLSLHYTADLGPNPNGPPPGARVNRPPIKPSSASPTSTDLATIPPSRPHEPYLLVDQSYLGVNSSGKGMFSADLYAGAPNASDGYVVKARKRITYVDPVKETKSKEEYVNLKKDLEKRIQDSATLKAELLSLKSDLELMKEAMELGVSPPSGLDVEATYATVQSSLARAETLLVSDTASLNSLLLGEKENSADILFMSPVHKAGTGWKEIGVPQGAPTSCSVSTMALHEMHVVREKEFSGYADDGLWFNPSHPDDLIKSCETLETYTQGVKVNQSKSKMLKRDGKWLVDSFVYLGLRYFPAKAGTPPVFKYRFQNSEDHESFVLFWISLFLLFYHLEWSLLLCAVVVLFLAYVDPGVRSTPVRIQANTRKGATLEFGHFEQFANWLSLARDRLIMEAERSGLKEIPSWMLMFSGSNMNRVPTSMASWHIWEYMQFKKHLTDARILFSGRLSGYWLSRLYLNTWTHTVPQDFELSPTRGSWVKVWWCKYLLRNRNHLHSSNRKHITYVGSQLITVTREIAKLSLELSKTLRYVYYLNWLLRRDYKNSPYTTATMAGWSKYLQQISSKMNFPADALPTKASTIIGPKGFILDSADVIRSGKYTNLLSKSENKVLEKVRGLYALCLTQQRVGNWLMNQGLIRLTIFNASTFGVDSMLRDYSHFALNPLIRYYDPKWKVKVPLTAEEMKEREKAYYARAYKRLRTSLLKKLKSIYTNRVNAVSASTKKAQSLLVKLYASTITQQTKALVTQLSRVRTSKDVHPRAFYKVKQIRPKTVPDQFEQVAQISQILRTDYKSLKNKGWVY